MAAGVIGPSASPGSSIESAVAVAFGLGAARFFLIVPTSAETGGGTGRSRLSSLVSPIADVAFLVDEHVVVRGWAFVFFGAAGATETLTSPGFSSSRFVFFLLGGMLVDGTTEGE